MKIGSRVLINDKGYNKIQGYGVIMYIAPPGSHYPIQVELEKPHKQHRVYRFERESITVINKELSPQDLTSKHYAVVNRRRIRWDVGERFIVGPCSGRPKELGYYNVYSIDTGFIIAGMIDNFFTVLEPYHEEARAPVTVPAPVAVIDTSKEEQAPANEAQDKPKVTIRNITITTKREKKKPKKVDELQKLEEQGQLNLFDFMEG